MKNILITGASSGIGAACVKQAAKSSLKIIATARNKERLKQLQLSSSDIDIITADISSKKGLKKLAKCISEPLDYIIHNAALLMPPAKFSEIKRKDFQKHMATNVEPILFLTQKLMQKHRLKTGEQGCRIITVSSGAARQAIQGLSHYCTSKAAAWMATEMLKIELQQYGILVNHYFPGVVDTAMQTTLRSANEEVFPFAPTFKDYKSNHQLAQPDEVAKHLLNTLTKTSNTIFNQNEWSYSS